ncbi:MAG: integrase [bacterium]|jgi:integrase
MVYNLRFDKLKKEIEGEIWGVILVTFSQNSVTKVISTKKKIKRIHFDKFFKKDLKRFRPTTIIDSNGINSEIETIIHSRNPFITATKTDDTDGYISFIRNELSLIANLSTRTTYTYIVESFCDFLKTKNQTDILLKELTFDLFRHYKAFLDGTLSYGTIRYYFIVHRSFVARGFDQELTDLVLNLKRFKLEKNAKKPAVLSDDDVNKLRSISPQHPLIKFAQFSMMQLFSNGLRYSDCLLIKFSDFGRTYLTIHQMKTNRVLQVPYSPMLIDTLYSILKYTYTPSIHPYNSFVNEQLSDIDSEFVNKPKQEAIVNYIISQPDRFLFDFVDPILLSYAKGTDMNEQQHKRYILHRVNHNNHLGKLIKPLKLSIKTLSSHSMRYAYTRMAIEDNIPIHIISRSLGHSSVAITENYIRNNFQLDKFEIIGEMFNNRYKRKFNSDK